MTESTRIAPGTLLSQQYRVEAWLGGGGYGDVYRAHSLRLDRPVALKVMRPRSDGDTRERFLREAQIAKRLEHPNTLRLLDYGDLDEGTPFLVWELLRGETLAERLARLGPMEPTAVSKLARQVLSSLEEAHDAGIVHRDIKPSNLMLCDFPGEPDFVKVLDFGVAKDVHLQHDDLTGEGEVLGTPRYMAPEQVLGKTVVPATDLYALGLVMAEALTAEAVVVASSKTQAVALQATHADLLIAPSVLSSPLGDLIRRATHKRIGARFSSARAMRDALEDERAARGVSAPLAMVPAPPPSSDLPETLSPLSVSDRMQRRETKAARKSPPKAPSRYAAVGIVAVGLMGFVVLAGSYWLGERQGPEKQGPEKQGPPTMAPSASRALPTAPTAKQNWHPPTRSVPAGTDLRSFDPLMFLPTAIKRAHEIFPDAMLTSVQTRGVWKAGRLDLLSLKGGHATYWFRSPKASKPPASHPSNLPYKGRCRVVVAVDDHGFAAQVPLDGCDEPIVPPPKCSMRGAMQRFQTLVGSTHTTLGASFDYRERRGTPNWLVEAGTIGSEFLPDDCPSP